MKLSLLIICTALLLTACLGSKSVKKGNETSTKTDTSAASAKPADTLKPAHKNDFSQEELAQVNKIMNELADIPFDFDKYAIPTEGLEIIKKDVEILNQMLSAKGKYILVTLEGHTDERGSEEYNLGLGEKRALMVKNALIKAGAKQDNLRIISYGEENPLELEKTEKAYSLNRRVHFEVRK